MPASENCDSKNFTVRDYRNSDFINIQALWMSLGLASRQRGDTDEVIEQTLKAGGKFLVLEETLSGKLVGTSWMTVDGRRNYLHHFGIAEAYQNRGLGRLLLDASIAFAREKGLQLKIEVHRGNQHAINLYTGRGFKYLGDYDVYIIRDI